MLLFHRYLPGHASLVMAQISNPSSASGSGSKRDVVNRRRCNCFPIEPAGLAYPCKMVFFFPSCLGACAPEKVPFYRSGVFSFVAGVIFQCSIQLSYTISIVTGFEPVHKGCCSTFELSESIRTGFEPVTHNVVVHRRTQQAAYFSLWLKYYGAFGSPHLVL